MSQDPFAVADFNWWRVKGALAVTQMEVKDGVGERAIMMFLYAILATPLTAQVSVGCLIKGPNMNCNGGGDRRQAEAREIGPTQ